MGSYNTNNKKCLGFFSYIYWSSCIKYECILYYKVLHFASFVSELKKTKVDLETLKSQATSTNNEYDRLLKEHEKLQVSWTQCLLNRIWILMLLFVVIFLKVYSDCFNCSSDSDTTEIFKICLSWTDINYMINYDVIKPLLKRKRSLL